MAKKTKEEVLNLEAILFKCRDILRQAKNAGSFFEKRDMMLTLIFLRFIGEKYEDGIANLREKLIQEVFFLSQESEGRCNMLRLFFCPLHINCLFIVSHIQ